MSRKSKNRQGLTLLELVVVMIILVALAGIVVPMLPGLMGRAHMSTGATNMDELNKLVLMHHAMEQSYCNGLDNLIDDAGTVFAKLPAPNPSIYSVKTLTAAEASALNAAGITDVYNLDDATESPTFDPYKDAVAESVATGLKVVQVTAAAVSAALDADLGTAEYVVFGLGKMSPFTGAGGMMLEAPVHFGEQANAAPDQVYSRFGLVFQLVAADGDPLPTARFAGSVAFHGDGIAGADAPLEAYYAGHNH
jgi:prepilin-type N-terminal cleavage/methylation domain-containing protein